MLAPDSLEWRIGGMVTGKTQSNLRNTCSIATLSTIVPMQTTLDLSVGPHGEVKFLKPV